MLGNTLFVLLACLSAYFLWPTSLGGCTTLTIVSGHSMEPLYHTGDVVVSRCGVPMSDEVIVYQPESLGGARIIHRVIGGDAVDGWSMKGDNNDFVDQFTPRGSEVLGTARLLIPKVGLAAAALTSPLVWLSVIALAIALLLWPRTDAEVGADDDSATTVDSAGQSDGGRAP